MVIEKLIGVEKFTNEQFGGMRSKGGRKKQKYTGTRGIKQRRPLTQGDAKKRQNRY